MKTIRRNLRETFLTIGELIAFMFRRGQWWLIPVLILALLLGLGLAVGQLGVFSFVYAII